VLATKQVTTPDEAQMGQQSLGVAVAPVEPPELPNLPRPKSNPGPRIVVYGSGALIQDAYLQRRELPVVLMLNTINWLAEREDLIAVPSRQLEGTPIVLDRAQMRVIFAIAVVLIPGGLFFGGISYTLMRRRR
jgi:hypothetical protein